MAYVAGWAAGRVPANTASIWAWVRRAMASRDVRMAGKGGSMPRCSSGVAASKRASNWGLRLGSAASTFRTRI